jgi:hypothetical protein
MQELRLVAVSEDGTYAILAVPGRSGRFLLPIDERLRTVAKGQFSRLAQYEIEVENPLRPKEIQERIRAGETADEIADSAGIPPDKIRRFEGPILAERQYQAQQAQRASIRGASETGPGPRLGDIVADRLNGAGANPDAAEWDSRKRPDGNWQVQLLFHIGGSQGSAEWIYDPRRRHVTPDDEQAMRLSLPQHEWTSLTFADRTKGTATVTSISSRQQPQLADLLREADRHAAVPSRGAVHTAPVHAGSLPPGGQQPGGQQHSGQQHGIQPSGMPDSFIAAPEPELASAPEGFAAQAGPRDQAPAPAGTAAAADSQPGPGGRPESAGSAKKASGKARRASVPSWDEIMFGTSRQPD